MAKRPRKLGMRHEKNRGGCIWSLVKKLHPRNGRLIRKLLLDNGRDGHGISQSNSDSMTMHDVNVRDKPASLITDHSRCSLEQFHMDSVSEMESNWFSQDSEIIESMAMSGKPSVKTLMEEEMIIEANADLRQSKYQSMRSESDSRNEQSLAYDVSDNLEYLGSLFRQRSAIFREHDEEKFSRGLGKVISQQLGSGRQLMEDEKLRRSKVFVSTLQVLNSPEFSVLDQEVTFKKCVEILCESQLGRRSSGEEEGDKFKMNVESSTMSSRIVILKPGMKELRKPGKASNDCVSREIKTISAKGHKTISGTPNFICDIKRKLKNVVAKEYSDVTADGKDLYPGKATRREGIKFEDNSKHEPARMSYQKKKYLSEAITDKDKDTSYPSQSPEVMGMILLYSELNNSPCVSPRRRWEHGSVNSPSGSSIATRSQIVCDEWRKPESTRRKETDVTSRKVISDLTKESGSGISSSYGKRCAQDMKKECCEREKQPSRQFPSLEMSLIIEPGDDNDLGVAIDLPERPSPVSVLEPPFADDDICPTAVKRVQFLREPLEIKLEEDDICFEEANDHVRTIEEDKESVSDQVRELLQASNLKWEDLYLKSQNSDRLIEMSLLRDQHFFKDNAKLMVDCVNESLWEVFACFFGRSCLSLVKQRIKPVPSMGFTIHEACRVVKWHLNPIPHPRSLTQIVGKDLSRRKSWLDQTFEGEGIGFEMSESIFSELLRDIIVSSVDDLSNGKRAAQNALTGFDASTSV